MMVFVTKSLLHPFAGPLNHATTYSTVGAPVKYDGIYDKALATPLFQGPSTKIPLGAPGKYDGMYL